VKVGVAALGALLAQNIVEIKFRRRRVKPGWPPIRRMLATNDLKFLNSMPAHLALNYKRPTGPPPFPVTPKNLVCAFDIFWQEYRNISCDDCNVVSIIPTKTPDEVAKFWDYFATTLSQLDAPQKEAFMKTT
jgi:hypothetical protein